MWQSLPEFGTGVLCSVLVAAAYTLGLSVAASAGRSRLLHAARLGAYGTICLVGLAVLLLAYAFVSHDFRVMYVAHYSDRVMSTPYLLAALWGGQDGSLLWWLFLTALFSAICIRWLAHRYVALQPHIIATLMSIIGFFAILMLFAANPFATSVAGAPPEGQGLNYQLRNFYMIIHPPSLYVGFTTSAVPFSFAISALITGRLDNEWIAATRKWMLFSFLFLTIGNVLGMLWAYEELGWGGPWSWDPVENAAFLPWLTCTAYVHSIIIQERRGMLKLWNVILICLTFFLTIFGTFLTRSGLIASVHSFAASGIGVFFVWFMGVLVAACAALIVYRLPKLVNEGSFDDYLSRDVAFMLNNWGFLSLMVFIAVTTLWPSVSESLFSRKATLGPTFYNAFVPPIAFVVLAMMGAAPLLGWRKTSPELFLKGFRFPLVVSAVVAIAHLAVGKRLGFPPFVHVDPIYPGNLGMSLAKAAATYPFTTVVLVAFNLAVVAQEFARGLAARRATHKDEFALTSLLMLVSKAKRRYGGYIVHVGIAVMFIGFAGRAWSIDREATLARGGTTTIEGYSVTYAGPRMESDAEKRMVFADVEIAKNGRPLGRLNPAQFIYKDMGGQRSTEVARYTTLRDDLYLVVGMVNPESKEAAFQIHVNTLIAFIWIGAAIVILGTLIAMWPDATLGALRGLGYVRALGLAFASAVLAFVFAGASATAYANPRPDPPPLHVSAPLSGAKP